MLGICTGKRKRNYKLIKEIGKGDEIVEIKNTRDSMLSNLYGITEKTMQMRRISYKNLDENEKDIVIYTSLLEESISKEEIILKYSNRWDIEISIREIKTLMDINIIRSKTPGMALKELSVSLTAYNYIRHIMAKVAEKCDFSPKEISFKNSMRIIVQYLWTSLAENIRSGLQDAEDILSQKIKKHKIRKRPGRSYPRRTKIGKYQKYK